MNKRTNRKRTRFYKSNVFLKIPCNSGITKLIQWSLPALFLGLWSIQGSYAQCELEFEPDTGDPVNVEIDDVFGASEVPEAELEAEGMISVELEAEELAEIGLEEVAIESTMEMGAGEAIMGILMANQIGHILYESGLIQEEHRWVSEHLKNEIAKVQDFRAGLNQFDQMLAPFLYIDEGLLWAAWGINEGIYEFAKIDLTNWQDEVLRLGFSEYFACDDPWAEPARLKDSDIQRKAPYIFNNPNLSIEDTDSQDGLATVIFQLPVETTESTLRDYLKSRGIDEYVDVNLTKHGFSVDRALDLMRNVPAYALSKVEGPSGKPFIISDNGKERTLGPDNGLSVLRENNISRVAILPDQDLGGLKVGIENTWYLKDNIKASAMVHYCTLEKVDPSHSTKVPVWHFKPHDFVLVDRNPPARTDFSVSSLRVVLSERRVVDNEVQYQDLATLPYSYKILDLDGDKWGDTYAVVVPDIDLSSYTGPLFIRIKTQSNLSEEFPDLEAETMGLVPTDVVLGQGQLIDYVAVDHITEANKGDVTKRAFPVVSGYNKPKDVGEVNEFVYSNLLVSVPRENKVISSIQIRNTTSSEVIFMDLTYSNDHNPLAFFFDAEPNNSGNGVKTAGKNLSLKWPNLADETSDFTDELFVVYDRLNQEENYYFLLEGNIPFVAGDMLQVTVHYEDLSSQTRQTIYLTDGGLLDNDFYHITSDGAYLIYDDQSNALTTQATKPAEEGNWLFERWSEYGGIYAITNEATGRVLGLDYTGQFGTHAFVPGEERFFWQLIPNEKETMLLRNVESGEYLSVATGVVSVDALWTELGTVKAKDFAVLGDDTYTIWNRITREEVLAYSGANSDVRYVADATTDAQWETEYIGAMNYTIKNVSQDTYLAPDANSSGSVLQTDPYYLAIDLNDNGLLEIIDPDSDKRLMPPWGYTGEAPATWGSYSDRASLEYDFIPVDHAVDNYNDLSVYGRAWYRMNINDENSGELYLVDPMNEHISDPKGDHAFVIMNESGDVLTALPQDIQHGFSVLFTDREYDNDNQLWIIYHDPGGIALFNIGRGQYLAKHVDDTDPTVWGISPCDIVPLNIEFNHEAPVTVINSQDYAIFDLADDGFIYPYEQQQSPVINSIEKVAKSAIEAQNSPYDIQDFKWKVTYIGAEQCVMEYNGNQPFSAMLMQDNGNNAIILEDKQNISDLKTAQWKLTPRVGLHHKIESVTHPDMYLYSAPSSNQITLSAPVQNEVQSDGHVQWLFLAMDENSTVSDLEYRDGMNVSGARRGLAYSYDNGTVSGYTGMTGVSDNELFALPQFVTNRSTTPSFDLVYTGYIRPSQDDYFEFSLAHNNVLPNYSSYALYVDGLKVLYGEPGNDYKEDLGLKGNMEHPIRLEITVAEGVTPNDLNLTWITEDNTTTAEILREPIQGELDGNAIDFVSNIGSSRTAISYTYDKVQSFQSLLPGPGNTEWSDLVPDSVKVEPGSDLSGQPSLAQIYRGMIYTPYWDPAPSVYDFSFRITGDNAANLFVDGILVAEHDGQGTTSATVTLDNPNIYDYEHISEFRIERSAYSQGATLVVEYQINNSSAWSSLLTSQNDQLSFGSGVYPIKNPVSSDLYFHKGVQIRATDISGITFTNKVYDPVEMGNCSSFDIFYGLDDQYYIAETCTNGSAEFADHDFLSLYNDVVEGRLGADKSPWIIAAAGNKADEKGNTKATYLLKAQHNGSSETVPAILAAHDVSGYGPSRDNTYTGGMNPFMTLETIPMPRGYYTMEQFTDNSWPAKNVFIEAVDTVYDITSGLTYYQHMILDADFASGTYGAALNNQGYWREWEPTDQAKHWYFIADENGYKVYHGIYNSPLFADQEAIWSLTYDRDILNFSAGESDYKIIMSADNEHQLNVMGYQTTPLSDVKLFSQNIDEITTNEEWIIEYHSGMRYTIKSRSSGLYLGHDYYMNYGPQQSNNTIVIDNLPGTFSTTHSSKWVITKRGPDRYALENGNNLARHFLTKISSEFLTLDDQFSGEPSFNRLFKIINTSDFNSLMAHYPLNNDQDIGPYAFETPAGSQSFVPVLGNLPNGQTLALDLDGSNHMPLGIGAEDLDMRHSNFTLGAWVYRTDMSSGETKTVLGTKVWQPRYTYLGVRTQGSAANMLTKYYDGSHHEFASPVANILGNGWYYLTWVYNLNQGSIAHYVNGEPNSSSSFIPLDLDNSELTIGSENGSYYFDGQISNLKIWRNALTDDEVWDNFQEEIQTDRLLAHYDFETDASDLSWYLRHGTENGTAIVADKYFGKVVQFDGTDDYIDIPDFGPKELSEGMTWSSWVKFDRDETGYNEHIVVFSSGAGEEITLSRAGSTNHIKMEVSSGGSVSATLAAYDAIIPGEWIHVATTIDESGNAILYVNGVPHDEVQLSVDMPEVTWTTNYLGRSTGSGDAYFQGQMEGVKVWSKVLDHYEIYSEYQATKGDGLIASYAFDMDATDDSGNENHGTIHGVTFVDDPVRGIVARFDGVDDRIEPPLNPDFHSAEISISTWFKKGSSNTMVLAGCPRGYQLRLQDAGSSYCRAYIEVDDDYIQHNVSHFLYYQEIWHHLAMTYDENDLILYIDGVEVSSTSISGSLPIEYFGTDPAFVIGLWLHPSLSYYYPYEGLLDDMKVWRRGLSAEEILAEYEATLKTGRDDLDLIAAYEFDNYVHDVSGNGHHAELKEINFINDPTRGIVAGYDGVDDFIDFSTSTDFNPCFITASSWFKTDPANPEMHLLHWDGDGFQVILNETASGDISVYLDSDPAAVVSNHLLVSNAFQDDKWHQVAFTYDGLKLILYLDGTEIGQHQTTTPGCVAYSTFGSTPPSSGLHFGKTFDEITRTDYAGLQDDTKIWGRALSADEILADYQASFKKELNLIAHYELDGDASDASGNEHHGTIVNTVTFVEDPVRGSVAQFDLTDYIDLGDDTGLKPANVTISAWFKTGSTSDLALLGFDTKGYALTYQGGIPQFWTYVSEADNLPYSPQIYHQGTYHDDQWHHAVMTYDGQTIALYIDGVEAAPPVANTLHNIFYDVTGELRIGSASGNYYYDGLLDDVKIWGNALDADQIKEEYKATRKKDLLAHYAFNGDVTDGSGHDNHGTIVNNISFVNDPIRGSVASFTGQDGDYIDLPELTPDKELTVSTWVKTDAVKPMTVIGTDLWGYSIRLTLGNDVGGRGCNGNENWNFVSSNGHGFVDGLWHHVVLSFDGTLRIYMDGVSLAELVPPSAGDLYYHNSDLTIGKGGTGANFEGLLDEVKIWATALSAEEIAAEYEATRIEEPEDLIAHYTFDGDVMDNSGHGHDGTVVNNVTFVNDPFRGNVASFTGNDGDYIDIPDLLPDEELTVSVWVRTESTKNMNVVSTNVWGYRIILNTGSTVYGQIVNNGGNNWNGYSAGGHSYVDGRWHQYVLKFDGTIHIYLDGTKIDHVVPPSSGDIHYGRDGFCDLTIGNGNAGINYEGLLDEVKIWRVALSDEEIEAEYEASKMDGLLAHYALDHNAADYSGNGNHGTVMNDVTFTEDPIRGNVASFDGTEDYIDIPNLNPEQEVTISAWFNVDNTGTVLPLVGDWAWGSSIRVMAGANSTLSGRVSNKGSSVDYNGFSFAPPSDIVVDEWYHSVLTFKDNVVSVYLDGILVDQQTSSVQGDIHYSDSDLGIGRDNINNPTYMNGLLDEVKIWSVALSADEIKAEFEATKKEGLIVHYEFDGDATDLSDYGHDGEVNGVTFMSDPVRGQVAYFDGNDDYIKINSSEALNNAAKHYTASAWVKPTLLNNWNSVMFKEGRNYSTYIQSSGYVYHRFHDASSTDSGIQTSAGMVPINKWTHIAVTNDGTTAKAFVNGILQKSGSVSGDLVADISDVLIGKSNENGSSGSMFTGYMDEVKIWTVALTKEEVSAEYQNSNTHPLVAHYPLDTDARDLSVYGNDGTFYNVSFPTDGERGLVASFNGSGQYISLPAQELNLNSSLGTVALWVKYSQDHTGHMFYGSESGGDGWGGENELHISAGSYEGRFFVTGNGLVGSSTIAGNNWHYLAASWDVNGEVRFYVNGSLITALPYASNSFTLNNVYLGRPAENTRYYNGWMDDVKIWHKILTPDEVFAEYQSGNTNARVAVQTEEENLEEEVETDHSFSLYPNPTENSFTLEFYQESMAPVSIRITDLSGRLMLEEVWEFDAAGNKSVRIENLKAKGFTSGIYLVNVRSGSFGINKSIRLILD